MAEAIFTYEGHEIKIQCKLNEKMKEICDKFVNKIGKDINSIIFLYNSEIINNELTFSQQVNEQDLKRNKIEYNSE